VARPVSEFELPEGTRPRRGLPPEFADATTIVSFKRPRWSMSSRSAERPRSSFGQCRFFQGPEVRGMRVPAVVSVAIGHRGPVHLTNFVSCFDQAARHDQTLTERVWPIGVRAFSPVSSPGPRVRAPSGEDQVVRFTVVLALRRNRPAPSPVWHGTVDALSSSKRSFSRSAGPPCAATDLPA